MKFDEFALSLGVDLDGANDEQKSRVQALYEAKHGGSPDPEPSPFANSGGKPKSLNDAIAEAEEEHRREQEIKDIAMQAVHENPNYAKKIGDLANVAIDTKLDPIKFERDLLRAVRHSKGFFSSTNGGRPQRNAKLMECALAMTAGLDAVKHYGEELCEQVEDAGMRGFGLQQAIMEAAGANGGRVRPGERITNGNIRNVFRAAFRDDGDRSFSLAGEISGIDIPGILGNVANKALLEGYMEIDATWREISTVRSVQNFHQHTFYRMLDNMEYEEVGPGGEIPHGTAAEESYTGQARTYAKMMGISRQDIINDDLSALDRVRGRLGMGAAQAFNNIVWAKFMDNAAHYTGARQNYIEGATTNLGLDGVGLEQGILAYRTQRSPSADGERWVGATLSRPTKLLVPPELEFTAQRLYQSTNLQSGTTNDPGNPDANIHANQYRPVVQPRLSDPAFTGNSATAWYLMGEELMPVVVTFLNGQQTPTIESADADFNVLAILLRGFFDFGADLAEYLGSVKSKGAA